MRTLQGITFTSEETRDLCAIINEVGDGQHPVPDENSLPFFTLSYAVDCVRKVLTYDLTSEARVRATVLLAKLSAARD